MAESSLENFEGNDMEDCEICELLSAQVCYEQLSKQNCTFDLCFGCLNAYYVICAWKGLQKVAKLTYHVNNCDLCLIRLETILRVQFQWNRLCVTCLDCYKSTLERV